MFIKIKLEPHSLKVLEPLKKISYFSIDDDATIIDLKMKIEQYVDVAPERQEIRTLVEVFQNDLHVQEVCDVRGSALMLYAYDEHRDLAEPHFVCFLQIYTNELAAQQQELEQRSKLCTDNIKITTLTGSTSTITLIASSDGDSSETDIETSSTKGATSDLDSGSSTENSYSSCRKKRGKHERKYILQNKKLKVTATTESQYSETLCQYLDEFPKCSRQINSTKDIESAYNMQSLKKSSSKETTSNDIISASMSSEIEKTKQNENERLDYTKLESKRANSSKIQSNIVTTTINKRNNNNGHPCYSISPEIRDFLAIISTIDMEPIGNVECKELLEWFFDRFRLCDSSSNLEFDAKAALSLFDDKLWIACMNVNTFEWISKSINEYLLKSYKILALKDSKHLCEIVVPVVSNSKNVLDIFDLLENQNENIITLKWSLQGRQTLLKDDKDFNEKAVSTFCSNEMFKIAVDTESKNYLEELNYKLKYCFWQIVFKFI